MQNQPCIPGINPTSPWCINPFINFWIWFANICLGSLCLCLWNVFQTPRQSFPQLLELVADDSQLSPSLGAPLHQGKQSCQKTKTNKQTKITAPLQVWPVSMTGQCKDMSFWPPCFNVELLWRVILGSKHPLGLVKASAETVLQAFSLCLQIPPSFTFLQVLIF